MHVPLNKSLGLKIASLLRKKKIVPIALWNKYKIDLLLVTLALANRLIAYMWDMYP